MPPSPPSRSLAALAALCLGGCSLVHAPLEKPPPAARSARPTSAIEPDLALMSRLPQIDPARQAEEFQAAKDAAQLSPTTTNRLRYALALATPGHGGADPVAAERQLSEILARPETLLPEERMLASVVLGEVERQLVLESENARLRSQPNDDDARTRLGVATRRLAAAAEENARLRKALQDARAKLEAVTHIERSINERGADGAPPP
ncbi:MAG: hypothetical protein KGL34_11040 [Gammaproteobacteria bacterium]|nr:hypothetical protein [Gammaproteobacteria bacterium]